MVIIIFITIDGIYILQDQEFVELQGFPPMGIGLPLKGLKLLVIRGGPQPRIEVFLNGYILICFLDK